MQTQLIRVHFDVRRYNEKLPREQRAMLADNENITAAAVFAADELPAEFIRDGKPDVFVRQYTTRAAKEAGKENDAFAVKFKIGGNCRWFNESAQPTQRPTNAELESGKFLARIDFARREADPNNAKRPCGYWVNAIMLERISENPFASFQPLTTATTPAPAAATTPAPTTAIDTDGELPF